MAHPVRMLVPVPLPTNLDAEWPPANLKGMYDDIVIADAWWSDDPDKLKAVYSSPVAQTGSGRRGFWSGRQKSTTSADHRAHVPIASDVAQAGADLIFGDEITWTVPEAHDLDPASDQAVATRADALKAEARLAEIAEANNLHATLLAAAELAGGLSGVYLRPTWDKAVADHPLLHVIHPDRAAPEFAWGQMVAVTFWTELSNPKPDGVVWRHLERHEPGMMLNGLYAGSATHLGVRQPLTAHPSTARMVDELNLAATFGWSGLFAFYVPNVCPNRKRRDLPIGRPDTMGSETLMDALDRTMSSWMRDIDLGKARLIVPDDFLSRTRKGNGAAFDADREIFSPLDIDPEHADRAGITPVEFKIRTEEHLATAAHLTETIVTKAGYSPQTFGLKGSGAEQTATEVDAREGRSWRTTSRKRGYWRPNLASVGGALLAIDRVVFKRPTIVVRPQVQFPELGQEDAGSVATTVNMLKAAQAASIETRVSMVHPDWDQPAVDAEVQRIKAEESVVVADPTGGFP